VNGWKGNVQLLFCESYETFNGAKTAIFRCVRASHDKDLLISSCLSASIGAAQNWTDFCEISYWGLLQNSVEGTQFRLKSYKSIGHFILRRGYFYIANSSTKHISARRQCKGNTLLHFLDDTEHFYIVISYMYVTNNTKVTHCCFTWQQWLRERAAVLRYMCNYQPCFKRLILEQSSQIYFMACC
jgi:hypothetical protein